VSQAKGAAVGLAAEIRENEEAVEPSEEREGLRRPRKGRRGFDVAEDAPPMADEDEPTPKAGVDSIRRRRPASPWG